MRASSLEQLFDFETAMEAAVVAALTAAGITAHSQRDSADRKTPRVEVQFSSGAVTGHMAMPGRTQIYDQFSGTLRLTVVTDRAKNEASHSVFISKIRSKLYQPAKVFTEANLPFYDILDVQDQGLQIGVDPERNLDVTVNIYSIRFGINSEAWPIDNL